MRFFFINWKIDLHFMVQMKRKLLCIYAHMTKPIYYESAGSWCLQFTATVALFNPI